MVFKSYLDKKTSKINLNREKLSAFQSAKIVSLSFDINNKDNINECSTAPSDVHEFHLNICRVGLRVK